MSRRLKCCLHSVLLVQLSANHSGSMEVKALKRLDFRPLGGSIVIFMPFCSTEIGKASEGIAVLKIAMSLLFLVSYSIDVLNGNSALSEGNSSEKDMDLKLLQLPESSRDGCKAQPEPEVALHLVFIEILDHDL